MIIARRLLTTLAMICAGAAAFSQDTEEFTERTYPNYVGVQVNQLVRQILNFGGSASGGSPYVINWAFNNRVTGWGFGAGFGYTYNQVKSGDAISQLSSTFNDFHLRFGPERKASLGKRWITSLGGDLVIDAEKNKTVANNQGAPSITTENTTNRFGAGLRFTLNYAFNDRMLLGTEGSYYLKFNKETRTLSSPQSSPPNTSKTKSFVPVLPTAIYLIFKFK